jgi:hypothetical protein
MKRSERAATIPFVLIAVLSIFLDALPSEIIWVCVALALVALVAAKLAGRDREGRQ